MRVAVPAFDADDLRRRGFEGFVRVDELEPPEPTQVPAESGAYAVIRTEAGSPAFLKQSGAGWWKGQDPTVPLERLQAEWVDGAQTLYLGKAANLRERIGLLVWFGRGEPKMHYGGRLLWQVERCETLLVAWRVEPGFAALEAELVAEFEVEYGRLPFANLNRPRAKR